jgi:hypothetical protein
MANVVFDDGTGEALLYIEDDPVLHLLKGHASAAPLRDTEASAARSAQRIKAHLDFAALQKATEDAARTFGSISCEPIYAKFRVEKQQNEKQIITADPNYDSNLVDYADYSCRATSSDIKASNPLPRFGDAGFKRAEEMLESFACAARPPYAVEIIAKILFKKEDRGKECELVNRPVKLQDNNEEYPWRMQTCTMNTRSYRQLSLLVMDCTPMDPHDVVNETYALLSEYLKKKGPQSPGCREKS